MEFIRKRLQVFVSSTFSDLVEQRQAAVEAILTAGHIPAGMELFTAGDESQMDVIKQWIDESDIYLVIVGGRYGSVEPKSQKSYTQIEYEYAMLKDKPVFACVINESALEVRVKELGSSVLETDEPQKMKDFRTLVLGRMVRFWDDSKDIKISVGETLSHFARRDDLNGWIRESEQANLPALADEVARLSKENAELRAQLVNQSNNELNFAGLSFPEFIQILNNKGLLDKIIHEVPRGRLAEDFYSIEGLSREEIVELAMIGFLEPTRLDRDGDQMYRISRVGQFFLNRFDAQNLTIDDLLSSEH